MTPRTKARPKARAQTPIPTAKTFRMPDSRTIVTLYLPLPQAKKLRDFANLSEEERVEALYPFICAYPSNLNAWKDRARAVLSAIGL